ncbi:MAG: porin family protein [Saprospiraceae bacterium]|nr:porin family protein [Saprospiraceae bacterium]
MKVGLGVSDIAFKQYGQSPYIGYENNSLIQEKPLFSFQGGFFMLITLSHKWTLQPEMLYASKGINYSKNFLYDDITFRLHINYLQVPLILGYQIGNGKVWSSRPYFGSYAAWKINAKRLIKVEGVEEQMKISNLKTFDFGGLLGCAVNRKLTSGEFTMDFRISYSLINMMNPIEGHIPEYNHNPDAYARNICITLSAGYLFENIFKEKKQ